MKASAYLITMAIVGLSLGYLMGEAATNKPAIESLKINNLKVKTLSVVDDDGKSMIQMTNTAEGPGIWLTAPNGDHTCIIAMKDQHSVYMMKKDGKWGNIGLSLHKDGGNVLFTDKKGNYRTLPLEKLTDLVTD